jgi:predicted DNA-binding transcriptional regulator AlpA
LVEIDAISNTTVRRALTEHEAAQRLGLSVATLRAWRGKRRGPRFAQFGRAVRYMDDDIDAFIAANLIEPSKTEKKDP